MNIAEATHQYETWVSQHTALIRDDLEIKREKMRKNSFAFLRATFYRWCQTWPECCPDLLDAPLVLGIGDLHVENFGTWRDPEGRLIWGVNDFDEGTTLPYTNDLVRLATSALLAARQEKLDSDEDEACEAILRGYRQGIEARGIPFVLPEGNDLLWRIALARMVNHDRFWQKLDRFTPVRDMPRDVKTLLLDTLPHPYEDLKIIHRISGLGSLGRERYTAIAVWRDGKVVREVKRLLPSAWNWATDNHASEIRYQEILENAVRSPDPYTRQVKVWVLRRLAPDCVRLTLADVPRSQRIPDLLYAMGLETANVHFGCSPQQAEQILIDLEKRPADWLLKAAKAMVKSTHKDWQEWKELHDTV